MYKASEKILINFSGKGKRGIILDCKFSKSSNIVLASFLLLFILLVNCHFFSPKGKDITDESIQRYMKAHIELRKWGITLGEQKVETNQDTDKPQKELLEILSKQGFSLEEFMLLNTRILGAMTIIETEDYNNRMKSGESDMDTALSEAWTTFENMLNDPDLSEEAKEDIRKQLQESKENYRTQKRSLEALKKKNEEIATPILKMTSKLASENDLVIVRKHHKELRSALTGYQF